jgi:excisionase family DNA binding protein
MNNAAGRQRLPQAKEVLPQAKSNSDVDRENAITSESLEGYGPDRSWLPKRHPDLLDWDEAAAILGCSKTTLKRIRRAGKIGFTPIGSGSRPRIWFHRKDIEEYLEAQRQVSPEDAGEES